MYSSFSQTYTFICNITIMYSVHLKYFVGKKNHGNVLSSILYVGMPYIFYTYVCTPLRKFFYTFSLAPFLHCVYFSPAHRQIVTRKLDELFSLSIMSKQVFIWSLLYFRDCYWEWYCRINRRISFTASPAMLPYHY